MIKLIQASGKGEREIDDLIGDSGRKIDLYEVFIKDLFEIRNPKFYKKPDAEAYDKFRAELLSDNRNSGVWVYYPWLNAAYLCPPEEIYLEVITARNKPLISRTEQEKYYNFNVGIVGLSVGQSSALTLVRTGGAKRIKLADFDTIDPSNLNRIHFGLPEIGRAKTEVVAERLYEINPYADVSIYREGITPQNIEDFFIKDFKLDAVIDACDSFPIKIALREYAKKMKIPLLMATDIGDGTLLDIERYDLSDQVEMFGGRLKTVKSDDSFMQSALKIIDPEYIPISLLEVLPEIGSSTPTHPQLATSVYFSGIIISYALRRLSNGKDVADRRHYIELEEYLDPRHQTEQFKKYKKARILELKRQLGLENV